MPSTVDALILCHNRPDEVQLAVDSLDDGVRDTVVLDNGSSPPLPQLDGARLLRSDDNTGVTRGRNLLLEATDADYAIFIDDDAVACSELADVVRRHFDEDPSLAVLAFRITRPDGSVKLEHPFRGRPRDVDVARPCGYFVGAGYAVRTHAVASVGGYDDELFYSTEEIDLSMALQRDGWTIRYEPALHVEHRPSTRGRGIAPQVPAFIIRNRLVYVRRHLPLPLAVVHGCVWSALTLRSALRARGVGAWARAIRDGLRRPIERRPLSWAALRTLHQRGGRVVF